MVACTVDKNPSGLARSVKTVEPAEPKPVRRGPGWKPVALGGLGLLVVAAAFAAGEVPRRRQEQILESNASVSDSEAPGVSVAIAREAPPDSERVLPGNAQALMEAALFPRITGYLKSRSVDIGDHVKAGQVLAIIDAPDADDQLAQARANLNQAKANLSLAQANANLAKITLSRDIQAGPGKAIPFIQIDQEKAAVKTTEAQVAAAEASIAVNEATVQRFTDLTRSRRSWHPFPAW
jgi:membrane fusion protein (multidrug efflux system)